VKTFLLNQQPISKLVRGDGALLVHSIFHTIQGEGPLSGHPAIFVRLAGCNLRCPQCDTEYTDNAQLMTPSGILQEVQRLHDGPRLVVISGGEPFRQPEGVGLLTLELYDADYQIQIETNGTLPPPRVMAEDTLIVVSPKTGKVDPFIEIVACAYKYVINSTSVDPLDGLPTLALGHTAHPRVARPPDGFTTEAIYLSPADDAHITSLPDRAAANMANRQAAIKSCMDHGYTLSLQVHKIIGME
jgi:7-carboxy-7-deazaguanine synthase